jgi:hypothetical protein
VIEKKTLEKKKTRRIQAGSARRFAGGRRAAAGSPASKLPFQRIIYAFMPPGDIYKSKRKHINGIAEASGMRTLDKREVREIARSDLAPGFATLKKEQPNKYMFDEMAFEQLPDNDLTGMVEYYSSLVKNGMGWKGAVQRVYEKAKESSLKGFV